MDLMDARGYTAGLRTIMAALEASGFEHWNIGRGLDYTGEVFSSRTYVDPECSCGQEGKEAAWLKGNDHEPACFNARLDKRVQAAGREMYDDFDADKLEAVQLASEMEVSPAHYATICTCDYWARRKAANLQCTEECEINLPNFVHHSSGLKIQWYKRIGRGIEVKNGVDARTWSTILAECLTAAASTTPPPEPVS